MTVASGEGLPGLVVSGAKRCGCASWPGGQLQATADHAPRRVAQRFRLPHPHARAALRVVELFTRSDLQPDPPLAAAVSDLGSRLGEFIER